MPARPMLTDVARRAGVHVSTASRALADLSAAIRQRGYAVGDDLGMAVMGRRPEPRFAGVDERTHTIGARAAQLLTSMLQQNQRGIPADPIVHQLDGRFNGGLSLPDRTQLNRRIAHCRLIGSVPA
jgi:DNA-binding LacI/PurR family transcriptional regulator